jgi:uncharacterized protein YjiS (DUF1127 family)
MTTIFRSWCQTRRYRATVAGLQALSAAELSALWITPKDIPDLARKLAVV